MIRIVIEYDEQQQRIGAAGQHHAGGTMNKMEIAYYLSRTIPNIMREGLKEVGARHSNLIHLPDPNTFNVLKS
jgi:hypothetical protein